MARENGARKLEIPDEVEEPRAPQAFTTGEYEFFRGSNDAGISLPTSSLAWLLPLAGVVVLLGLTFLLLT